jgi:xylose isomerase
MAGENPALSLSLATSAGKLFGVHLNDGNGFTDDGLIFGSVNIIKTLEFMYYLKKGCYEGLVYFDTFPLREDPFWETEQNIRMFNKVSAHVEKIGMEEIERSLDDSTAKFGQTFALNHLL